jgi:hypothetical protein
VTRALEAIDRHLPRGMGRGGFVFAVWSVSCVALALAVAVYVATTPGLAASLAGGGAAGGYFLRQLAFNGLPVVFALNLVGFALYRVRGRERPEAGLALEVALRAALFFGLHALIYPLSALAFGSFGGDPAQALGAVGPTLAQAAFFGNLAGVYLYAGTVGAFPLFAALMAARAGEERLGPVVLAFVPFSILSAFLCSGLALLAGRLVEAAAGLG